jgi:manganese/zinc/iron transport system permease protein
VAAALGGYWLAHELDASIAGSMATMTGVLFALVFLLAPQRGLLAQALERLRQRWEFAQTMLAIHLFNHEGLPEAEQECRIDQLHEHLRWKPAFVARVIGSAERQGLVLRRRDQLCLTPRGRQVAQQAIVR